MSDKFYTEIVTILSTRYGGAYENASWVALSCSADEIPTDDLLGDDISCQDFWEEARKNDLTFIYALGEPWENKVFMALGSTPQEAYENLLRRSLDD